MKKELGTSIASYSRDMLTAAMEDLERLQCEKGHLIRSRDISQHRKFIVSLLLGVASVYASNSHDDVASFSRISLVQP